MILQVEEWYNGYKQILRDSRPDGTSTRGQRSVLMLCNADVDAMASARILSNLLRCDAVQYQLMPCTSYSDMRGTLANMKDNFDSDDICSVILLNFGASKNLTKLYEDSLLPETVRMYVMDCRRPVHLANIYEDEAIVVFLNESKNAIAEFPSDGDDLSGNEEDSDSSDSEDDDEEDEDEISNSSDAEDQQSDDEDEHQASFDDIEGSAPEKKKAKLDAEYDGGDEEDSDDDQLEEHQVRGGRKDLPSKSSSAVNEVIDSSTPTEGDLSSPNQDSEVHGAQDIIDEPAPMSQRELHKDRAQRLIRYYHQGSYFASPISYIAYSIAEQLRHGEEGDLLWLACVGVTDAYLHSRLDKSGFGEIGNALKNSCLKMFPDTRVDRAMNSFNAENLDGRGRDELNGEQSFTKIKFSDNGRIFAESDYRFFLMRHSSLLDSMLYSEYVYSKLQMNTKKGQQRFMEMLAKMGLPLDECRQPFRFMKPSMQSRLESEFENYADVRIWKYADFMRRLISYAHSFFLLLYLVTTGI